jgi:hypothetical protein
MSNNQVQNSSHPMLSVAQSQGVLSHISSGNNTGSGFVIGSKNGYIPRPTDPVIIGPSSQPAGPTRNIVGPGGQTPNPTPHNNKLF